MIRKADIAEKLQDWLGEAYERSDGDVESEVWEELYHKVFSKELSEKVWENFPEFDFVDPDATYFEDVTAFINQFVDFANGN